MELKKVKLRADGWENQVLRTGCAGFCASCVLQVAPNSLKRTWSGVKSPVCQSTEATESACELAILLSRQLFVTGIGKL